MHFTDIGDTMDTTSRRKPRRKEKDMKTPTKSELYEQIEALQKQNIRLQETLEKKKRKEWELRRPHAIACFYKAMECVFPGMIKNVQLEHIDEGGYWFSFELINDCTRQTYAVRHEDID